MKRLLLLVAALAAFCLTTTAQCYGCWASEVTDPVTGFVGGVKVITTPGFSITGSKLTCKNGTCAWAELPQGFVCAPANNCEFNGIYIATYNDPFHRAPGQFGYPPCAIAGGGGTGYVLPGAGPDLSWLAACNGGNSEGFTTFYTTEDCNTGTFLGEVHFLGRCGRCPEEPPLPPGGDGTGG